MSDFSDALKSSLKEGETLVTGTVTRIVDQGEDQAPVVFFAPTSDVRHLHLEGHRVNTGELVSIHSQPLIPKQFDQKRVAFDGDSPKVGGSIALVHLDKQR